MIQLNVGPWINDNRERLGRLGYDEQAIEAFAYEQMMRRAMHDREAGETILEHVNALLKLRKVRSVLTYRMWDGDDLYAYDQLGRSCVCLGSWWDIRYVLRGVVRQKKRGVSYRFMPNGQASTGSIQLAYFGEDTQFRFQEFEGILERYSRVL